MNLKPAHLESFHEIIRTGSVTEAAKQLGLTQSAVSRHLAQLEAELGLQLFFREHGRLTPLREAIELHTEVDMALSAMARLSQVADDLKHLERGRVRVSGPPSFVETTLSDIVATFVSNHPAIQVTLDSRNHETIVDQAIRRTIDCGFVKLPVHAPGLHLEPVVTAGTACVVKNGHRLAKLEKIGPSDLQREPLILLGKGRAFQRHIERAFREASVRMRVKVETHAVGASCALASRGVGVAIVNSMLAQAYTRSGVKVITFVPDIEHSYAIIRSDESPLSLAASAFYDHCIRSFDS